MHPLARLDLRYIWHPFTQMRDWLRREPIVIVSGRGAVLRDAHGRRYIDANSSIWTNLHGHNQPIINAAIQKQLKRIAHSSALGLANEPASILAEKLIAAANFTGVPTRNRPDKAVGPRLCRVFYSDDGSTAMEVALKLAFESSRRSGRCRKPRFLTLACAYHGDTIGAVSLGQIHLFRHTWEGLLFKSDEVMAPYCYRCRYNVAKPERADARAYRKCRWECLETLERRFVAQKKRGEPYAGFVFEPLIQGAAGMIPQPAGWLRRATEIARQHNALLIADEVMTGFGRTGSGTAPDGPGPAALLFAEGNGVPALPRTGAQGHGPADSRDAVVQPTDFPLFACLHEGVKPDLMAMAKGMTGGYLPMAATLTTEDIFGEFLGEYSEFKTFFHGHSYTANQLGAAAALANMDILETPRSKRDRVRLEHEMRAQLARLWELPQVGDIRQVGLIAGIELVKNWRTKEPFDLRDRAGMRVCEAMAHRGVLTRPIGNVVVIMPPYCTTTSQMARIVDALHQSVRSVLG